MSLWLRYKAEVVVAPQGQDQGARIPWSEAHPAFGGTAATVPPKAGKRNAEIGLYAKSSALPGAAGADHKALRGEARG